MQNNLSQSKGKNQSGKVKNEVFEYFCIFTVNLHVAEGKKVRVKMVINDGCLVMSQLFGVNEF